MKPFPRRRIYLGIALGVILILGLASFGIIKLQETRSNRSLSKVAQPIIKMDLLAPQDHGWISDHEIFFLREKNQGDFMCIKADIRDGKETVLESLSHYLRDKEDRSLAFHMEPSPSGQKLGMAFESSGQFERYIHDLDSGKTTRLKTDSTFDSFWTWFPDESGWIEWASEGGNGFFPKRKARLYPASNFEISNQILQREFNFFAPPRFRRPDQLLYLTFFTDETMWSKDSGNVYFNKTILNLNDQEKTERTQIQENNDVTFSLISSDQTASKWLIAKRHKSRIGGFKRINTPPFFRLKADRYQLKIYDSEKLQWQILDPDMATYDYHRFKLNPSGTHFSFIYQGQIWVAAIADMLP